jgi:MerR family transcriptional regulator, light-induced transcriptional regulator
VPDSPLPLTPAGEAFLAALLRPDLTRAREVVREAADVGLPVDVIFEAVLTPALAEVGRRWAAGELSVAQEHMAAEVSQSLVAELTERIRRPTTSGRLAVVACSPKEEHCIGGQMLAGLLESADWEVLYLGRSLPLEDLAALADREVPDAVALSTTLREHLPGARAALEALRGLDRPPFLLVGGAAHGRGDQAAELGVGGWARTAAEGVGLLDARVPGAGDALR